MDIEEAKKIIQDKIQAEEGVREVRKRIKTYIHQDAREGFTETFKPLIETSEKVKESVDSHQNKLIKQLQENQLALTQGFEGNRKAITSGFDKMDEVKKWDLEQLPGYEAIEEEPEKEEEDETIEEEEEYEEEKIKKLEKQIEVTTKLRDNYYGLALSTDKEEAEENFKQRARIENEKIKKMKEDLEKMKTNLMEKKEKEIEKEPVTITDKKIEEQLNKNLVNTETSEILKQLNLDLSYSYINKDKQKFLKDFDVALKVKADLGKKTKNYTKEKKDSVSGIVKRVYHPPKKGSKASNKTQKLIAAHNILSIYVANMREVAAYKEITGTGIIHFNNPQQLVSRLELLAGSIIAGNNGVKQEFSQIAHLLHQLKIITKKTLNDLLKKYILLK